MLRERSSDACRGLSPPTRGNRGKRFAVRRRPRSIPAHAGEPHTGGAPALVAEVYPRPRGGTSASSSCPDARWGLSPPTRGNRRDDRRLGDGEGSIPAHAGEPHRCRRPCLRDAVYPRPRGGTSAWRALFLAMRGLSPPTRGNRGPHSRRPHGRRSIPAHAGEPRIRAFRYLEA